MVRARLLISFSCQLTVCGNHDIVVRKLLWSHGLAVAAMVCKDFQCMFRFHMSLHLLAPIAHDTNRCDDQSRPHAPLQDYTDHLQGFTEAHVVGQDATTCENRLRCRGEISGNVSVHIGVSSAFPELYHI